MNLDDKYTSCPFCSGQIRKHSVLCTHCKRILDPKIAKHAKSRANAVAHDQAIKPIENHPACNICQEVEKNPECLACRTYNRVMILLLKKLEDQKL